MDKMEGGIILYLSKRDVYFDDHQIFFILAMALVIY
jgi:hypothetical protein